MNLRNRMSKCRSAVYDVIREDDDNTMSGTIYDTIIIVFIIVTVALVILDTFNMPVWFRPVYVVIEAISVVVFTIEYVLRLWTAPLIYPQKKPWAARIRYLFTFMAIIDLLSILPAYLPFFFNINLSVLRIMRVIRLLRAFKISRYTDAMDGIAYVFKKRGHQLLSSVLIIFFLMIIASVFMFEVEHTAQPEVFNNALSAFWWTVSTVTTVGYGDVYPITPIGKLLGSVIALLGVGLVAIPTGIISVGFIESSNLQNCPAPSGVPGFKNSGTANDDEKHFCPYCGHKLD